MVNRVILLACLAGCTAPAEHPALQQAALPPLLQAHRFAYDGTARSDFRLSPDGGKLAWIGPSYARKKLFIRNNATGEVREYPVPPAGYVWTPDGRWLVYTRDSSGSENPHVFMLDVSMADSTAVDLTPYPGVRAVIHQMVTADSSTHLLVYHNRRDRKVFDLYRIDLETRKETLVASNPGDGVAPVTGSDGSFKGWQKSREAQRPPEQRDQPLAARQPALLKKQEDTVRMLGPSADRSFVWALSNRGRDRMALVAAHPTLGWERVVFEDPQVDVTGVTMSRVTQDPLIAHAMPGYPRDMILDEKLREDMDGLIKAQGSAPFGLEIVSTDNAEQRLIVSTYTSTQRRYYLVDRPRRSFVLLAQTVADDFAEAMSPVQPVTLASRDGLALHGYLTLPRGVAPRRLPMVLLVHGGPWMRAGWGDPSRTEEISDAQFLANRGYAVLQVNFRGSSGYGRSFLNAGMGEFAGRMQDDLLDAVRWAIDRGTADPSRVAIMGWSYGGYAALVGLTMTPDAFACGVSLGGPTDLASLIESFPPYWTLDLTMWHDFVGRPDNPQDREEMTRRSPLTYARQLQRPVLMVQGAKDVRVRVDQAERMVAELRRARRPVEYLRIEDMGHGMGWWVHRLAMLRRTEDFLHRCIGGRASRFDPFDAVSWVWQRVSGTKAPPR